MNRAQAARRVRRGRPDDAPFARRVAAVFDDLGDYRMVLPTWLASADVITSLAEDVDERGVGTPLGLTMLGLYSDGSNAFGDLLAIAVAPAAQRRGVGTLLLSHLIEEASRPEHKLREIRLSVAEGNMVGRRLFARFGFELVHGDHGTYDRGQRVLHMKRAM
jgi:ribosomal protein S18 acetylase RimI-like enzyme